MPRAAPSSIGLRSAPARRGSAPTAHHRSRAPPNASTAAYVVAPSQPIAPRLAVRASFIELEGASATPTTSRTWSRSRRARTHWRWSASWRSCRRPRRQVEILGRRRSTSGARGASTAAPRRRPSDRCNIGELSTRRTRPRTPTPRPRRILPLPVGRDIERAPRAEAYSPGPRARSRRGSGSPRTHLTGDVGPRRQPAPTAEADASDFGPPTMVTMVRTPDSPPARHGGDRRRESRRASSLPAASGSLGPREWTMSASGVDGTQYTIRVRDTSGRIENVEIDPYELVEAGDADRPNSARLSRTS